MPIELEIIDLVIPEESNTILGYSHFIKTVEDLEEIVKTTIPQAEYAIVFSEASGERLIRFEGNDQELIDAGIENIKRISSGHTFIIVMKGAYPINVLNALKSCQEVGQIYAATANPIKVIVAKSESGNGVLGVIDGFSPLGVEIDEDKLRRRELLKNIGYKR